MMTEHRGATDSVHKIKLESAIQQARWGVPSAVVGTAALFEVLTSFVGDGAEIELEFKNKGGKKLGSWTGAISGDRCQDGFVIPDKADEEIYFDVELPKHKLKAKSNLLRVKSAVAIRNARWDREEARRGDVLKLLADVKGLREGEPVGITIFEHDDDGAHDLVTQLTGTVRKGQVEAQWEYEYFEDTDEIPTAEESEKGYNPPEYFFRVEASGISADSGLLKFQDWVGISLTLGGVAAAGEEYVLHLPDGSERRGKLDDAGKAREKDVPPGTFRVEFPRFAKKQDESASPQNPA